MRWIVTLNGERQCVGDLTLYDGWEVVCEVPGELPEYHEIVDGEVVPILATYKEKKWEAVKVLRTTKENGTAVTPVGIVQIDEPSKMKIVGLLNACQLAEEAQLTFSEQFTLADNSVVSLDGTTMRQMAVAVSQYVSELYAHARDLRTAIEEAADMAELDAVDIETGWP